MKKLSLQLKNLCMNNKIKILLLSDGTGKTGKNLLKSIIPQYQDLNYELEVRNNIRSIQDLDQILLEASIHHDIIPFTFVDLKLRKHIVDNSQSLNVVDLLGPLIEQFSTVLKREPNYIPGLLNNRLDDAYFNKIEAIEFTLRNDENIATEDFNEADIILLGISGTSKTPLSLFLATEGYKVINITINEKLNLKELFTGTDQKKILCLTIDAHRLAEIRKKRMKAKEVYSKNYSDIEYVKSQLDVSDQLFKSNPLWPVFNVTEKSLDQIVIEMSNVLNQRKSTKSKQDSRFS